MGKARTAAQELADEAIARVMYGPGYDGEGYYYYDDEYDDEGSVGRFSTLGMCVARAALSYCNITIDGGALEHHRAMGAARRKRAKGKPRAGGAK